MVAEADCVVDDLEPVDHCLGHRTALLGVAGELQVEGQVIHVIARELFDHSALLGDLSVVSRDFR